MRQRTMTKLQLTAIDNTPPLGIDRRAHASLCRLREAHRIGLTHARKMLPEGGNQCVAGVPHIVGKSVIKALDGP